ncbi:MAG: hypothetical protein MI723_03055 [Caulobacterales bacterium]|nr:hypothetical protein [Caulobacterales bacterium]
MLRPPRPTNVIGALLMEDRVSGLRALVAIALLAATAGAGAALSDASRMEASLGVRSLHAAAF